MTLFAVVECYEYFYHQKDPAISGYVVLYMFVFVVLHEARIISFADSSKSCILICCSIKGMELVLFLGTLDVCCFFLLIIYVH